MPRPDGGVYCFVVCHCAAPPLVAGAKSCSVSKLVSVCPCVRVSVYGDTIDRAWLVACCHCQLLLCLACRSFVSCWFAAAAAVAIRWPFLPCVWHLYVLMWWMPRCCVVVDFVVLASAGTQTCCTGPRMCPWASVFHHTLLPCGESGLAWLSSGSMVVQGTSYCSCPGKRLMTVVSCPRVVSSCGTQGGSSTGFLSFFFSF